MNSAENTEAFSNENEIKIMRLKCIPQTLSHRNNSTKAVSDSCDFPNVTVDRNQKECTIN